MPMQSLGQPTQDRLVGIRRDAVDDQLSSGDAEYERRSLVKQTSDAAGEASNRRGERRVTPRIHRMLLYCNRQFDQELAQLAGQRDTLGLDRVHAWLLDLSESAAKPCITADARPLHRCRKQRRAGA